MQKLDRFFGYGAAPALQLREPPWDEARARGMALGRFDGVNNEVMLETPYAYRYAGRPAGAPRSCAPSCATTSPTAPADCPATTAPARCPCLPPDVGQLRGLFRTP